MIKSQVNLQLHSFFESWKVIGFILILYDIYIKLLRSIFLLSCLKLNVLRLMLIAVSWLLRAYFVSITLVAVCAQKFQSLKFLLSSGKVQQAPDPFWLGLRWFSWLFQPVPKRWFGHFYLIGCIWNAILFAFSFGTFS
jgi:hypothetical protein